MKYLLVLCLCIGALSAKMLSLEMVPQNAPKGVSQHINILDAKSLSFDRIDGQKFFGISALAFDKDTQILYMLSDRSRLFAFELRIGKDKITALTPLYACRLRDQYGRKFFIQKSDSEGMTLVKKGAQKMLLVSFEGTPRVRAFDLLGKEISKKYQTLSDIKEKLAMTGLPKILKNKKAYQSNNKMLESITYTSRYGSIVTPEYPLKNMKSGYHGLYTHKGLLCKIKKTNPTGAITELETMPDGNLLALEREFDPVHLKVVISLQKIYPRQRKNGICQTKDIANMTNKEGWLLDNFEGLTHYKDNQYLMISDDNDNFFQQTILVLFRLDVV